MFYRFTENLLLIITRPRMFMQIRIFENEIVSLNKYYNEYFILDTLKHYNAACKFFPISNIPWISHECVKSPAFNYSTHATVHE